MPQLPLWIPPLLNVILGRDPRRRRHVLFVLATGQLYAVSLAVTLQSASLGLLDAALAQSLVAASFAVFVMVYALVRTGWSARLTDPVLTFPHALACVALCMAAYLALGSQRGNVMILVAQTIVAAMFRLRPQQVLLLGCASVLMLALAVTGLHHHDPQRYTVAIGWLHLTVGGATILLLSLIAKWVADIRVRIGRQARELQDALSTVQQLATTDMLTGLMNRRMMGDILEREIRLSHRHGTPLCVALVDLDHFKQVNDRHGHAVGDAVLQQLADTARKEIRQVDQMARWGGEEFLLMLPNVTAIEAGVALERLRCAVRRMSVADRPSLQISISAGLAQLLPDETLDGLIERADDALYAAKHAGRDRWVASGGAQRDSSPSHESPMVMDLRSVARLQGDGA